MIVRRQPFFALVGEASKAITGLRSIMGHLSDMLGSLRKLELMKDMIQCNVAVGELHKQINHKKTNLMRATKLLNADQKNDASVIEHFVDELVQIARFISECTNAFAKLLGELTRRVEAQLAADANVVDDATLRDVKSVVILALTGFGGTPGARSSIVNVHLLNHTPQAATTRDLPAVLWWCNENGTWKMQTSDIKHTLTPVCTLPVDHPVAQAATLLVRAVGTDALRSVRLGEPGDVNCMTAVRRALVLLDVPAPEILKTPPKRGKVLTRAANNTTVSVAAGADRSALSNADQDDIDPSVLETREDEHDGRTLRRACSHLLFVAFATEWVDAAQWGLMERFKQVLAMCNVTATLI